MIENGYGSITPKKRRHKKHKNRVVVDVDVRVVVTGGRCYKKKRHGYKY